MTNQLTRRHHESCDRRNPDGPARELRFARVVPGLYNGFARSGTESGPFSLKDNSVKKLLTLLAVVSMLLPALADARDWRQGFGLQERGERLKDGSGQYQRSERDRRRERDERRHERLTDEERRELHRDLDRAHRELYRRKPPR